MAFAVGIGSESEYRKDGSYKCPNQVPVAVVCSAQLPLIIDSISPDAKLAGF